MIPLFTPPEANDTGYAARRWVKVGVLIAMVLGFSVVVFGRAPIMMAAVMLPLIAIVALAVMMLNMRAVQAGPAKEKRRPQGADMYTLIDRMVDDLDEDEAAYLRRRLDQREAGLQTDLPTDMQDLLDRRESDRRSGQR